nr:hypothetical protein [Saccharopolyspora shandongensis]
MTEFHRRRVEGVQAHEQGIAAPRAHLLKYCGEVSFPSTPEALHETPSVRGELQDDLTTVDGAASTYEQTGCLKAIAQATRDRGDRAELVGKPGEIDRRVTIHHDQSAQLRRRNLRPDAFRTACPDHDERPGCSLDLVEEIGWW